MKRDRRSVARGWLLGVGLAVVASAASAGALAPSLAQAGQGRTLMACVNLSTFDSSVFKQAPRTCVLHFSNKPYDGDDMAFVGSIRWSGWGTGLARGRGTFRGNMDYTSPATIVLMNKRRCRNGTRNYTRARITTSLGSGSGPLAACRR
jgi:hypothetical protein